MMNAEILIFEVLLKKEEAGITVQELPLMRLSLIHISEPTRPY